MKGRHQAKEGGGGEKIRFPPAFYPSLLSSLRLLTHASQHGEPSLEAKGARSTKRGAIG
jgi:hypothetical protein